MPVIVTDKSGKHVSGLQKEAFRIEENGSVRNLSVFEETETEKLVVHGKDATLDARRLPYQILKISTGRMMGNTEAIDGMKTKEFRSELARAGFPG